MTFYVIFRSKNSYTVPITNLNRYKDVVKLNEMSSKVEGWDFAPIAIQKYVKIEGDNVNLNARTGFLGYRINKHISKDDWLLVEAQWKLQGMRHLLDRVIARDFVSYNEAKYVAQEFAKSGTGFSNYNIKVDKDLLMDSSTNNPLEELNDFNRENNLLEQVGNEVKIRARQQLIAEHDNASVGVHISYKHPAATNPHAIGNAETNLSTLPEDAPAVISSANDEVSSNDVLSIVDSDSVLDANIADANAETNSDVNAEQTTAVEDIAENGIVEEKVNIPAIINTPPARTNHKPKHGKNK